MPIRADQPLYVVYVGPKLTRRWPLLATRGTSPPAFVGCICDLL